jgi:type IV pilus assembly protein PilA
LIRQDFLIGAKIADSARTVTFETTSSGQVASRRILLLTLSGLFLVLAIPGGRQDRLNAIEMAALRDILTITSMQTQYLSQFGKYAGSLAELGPAGDDVRPGPQAADLIPASLASGQKGGYLFTMASTQGGYTINAAPIVFGRTGQRTFYADQNLVIHQNRGQESASGHSPVFK